MGARISTLEKQNHNNTKVIEQLSTSVSKDIPAMVHKTKEKIIDKFEKLIKNIEYEFKTQMNETIREEQDHHSSDFTKVSQDLN